MLSAINPEFANVVYELTKEDEGCICYFCAFKRNHKEYERGEAYLAGPAHSPRDGNSNYICKNHLDHDAAIVNVGYKLEQIKLPGKVSKANRALVDKLVYDLEIEPDIFVTLKPGYRLGTDFSQDGNRCQHCFGEDSLKEVYDTLKDSVEDCECDVCNTEKAKS